MRPPILILLVILGFSYLSVHPALADETPAPCGDEIPCEQAPLVATADMEIINLTYEELKALLDSTEDFVLLDTRPIEAYEIGHIPDAESFPLSEMTTLESVEALPKDKLIVVYCQSASCPMSHSAAVKLKSFGFNVKDYHGGIQEWTEKGVTVEQDTTVIPPITP